MNQTPPEPSVLDFVIAWLTPWRSKKIEIPPAPEPDQDSESFWLAAEADQPGEAYLPAPVHPPPTLPYPWRSLLALSSALLGQLFLEPQATAWPAALFFYILAAIFLIISIRGAEWQLPTAAGDNPIPLKLEIRRKPLVFSLIGLAAAFLTFGGNQFTGINLFFWALAITGAFFALRQPDGKSDTRQWFQDKWESIRQINLHLTISTGWVLLVISAAVVIVFFRVYRLNEVPIEMFSDQAEKLWDVYDVLNGEYSIFFPRNTGREALQFYLTAAIASLFGTGLSFISLKIGTVLAGLATIPYIYLLGKELGSRRAGLLAAFLAGIAYWPNVISRIGLRFPLYPLFVAPSLFYLLRALRTTSLRDYILAGLALGIGLHGYTPIRILPLIILMAVLLFMLHNFKNDRRMGALLGLGILVLISFILFLPLFRYMVDNPVMFGYRAFSRLGSSEQAIKDPVVLVFLSNLWNALTMFFVDDGEIWVHSVPGRPALDIVTAAIFGLGCLLMAARYLQQRRWQDLFLLLSVPLLMMPSILSLAYPAENPALNRASGAIVPVFIIAALAFDGLLTAFVRHNRSSTNKAIALLLALGLLTVSSIQNFDLVFRQFDQNFASGAWNTSEIGQVVRGFSNSIGSGENVYVIPFPHWVDTRLVGINAGFPNRDFAITDESIPLTTNDVRPKLFILRPDDDKHIILLRALYPEGFFKMYESSRSESKNFLMFYVITKP